MKIISMSLYGDTPMYLHGIIENAKLMGDIYPDWVLRVYCSQDSNIRLLQEYGCQIRVMGVSRGHAGMFWRFLAAWDTTIERVIFRDADSRINTKEAAAVNDWEQTKLLSHCMHDHPHHHTFPLFGGMWGTTVGAIPWEVYRYALKQINIPQKRKDDMRFLREIVLPHIEQSLLRHSSLLLKWPAVLFPEHTEIPGFIGQQYNNDNQAIWP